MIIILLIFLIVSLIIQFIFFIPAYLFRTDRLTDLTYGLTFIILSLIAFFTNSFSLYKILLLAMIMLWGLRLAIFLFIRVSKYKKDSRFDNIRNSFKKFSMFWLLQGITVFIILIPTILSFNINLNKISIISILGIIIWLTGFLIETISDYQKFNFYNNKKNKKKWIDIGIWRYSRHPNYFGEILCWIGVYFYVLQHLSTLEAIISIISPLFIITLLLFFSGIPILEKSADKKFKRNKKYLEYKRKTSILIPMPRRN